jgi:hypothetical protein
MRQMGSSVYRRKWPDPQSQTCGNVFSLLASRFTRHVFSQGHISLTPRNGHRDSGGSDAVVLGSVCGLVFRREPGVSFAILTPVSVAGDMLGGLGAGLAVGGARFVPAVAPTGPASGPSGYAGFMGCATRRLEYRCFSAGCDVAGVALKPLRWSRQPSGSQKNFHHEIA